MTMLSRVLGLIRDHYQAIFFGTGQVAAFWEIAFMLPNMLRNLLAEGVLSQSFIPIYAQSLCESDEAAARTAGSIIGFLSVFLTGVVATGILVFPVFLPIYVGRPLHEISLLLHLSQVLFGFIMAVSLTAIFAGIAQTHERFIVPSFSPILLNLTFIAGFVSLLPFSLSQELNATIQAWVVLGGGVLQLVFQVWYVRHCGWMPKIHINLRDPALRRIFSLMGPAVLGASVFQLNQLMDIALASYFIDDAGAIPALRFAHRLIQLPTGIIGVALSTTILPALTTLIRTGESHRSGEEVVGAIGFALFLTAPAAMGFLFLGPWIIHLLFHGGEWTVNSTQMTWMALQFYAVAIPVYSFNKILTSAFYAYQDTRTPVRILFVTVSVNLAANLVLIHFLKQGGLALSTAISATVNFLLLNLSLGTKMGSLPWSKLRGSLLRIGPAMLALGALLLWLNALWPYPSPDSGTIVPVVPYSRAVLVVGVGAGLGGILYLFLCSYLKAPEMQVISDMLGRKFGRRRSGPN